ncbi:archaetidylserine decarboxylase [Diaphorobacter aerolatus]|uniref:Phosphatidylserine decarboxylase proenzyme n=1 Tax=Diaphorobacter aerolatus TaxID=1288495 RepID=A0A7H0GK71_9BURK|nr:archaetidylserine decarboxylase [Diaphorobacter aerolatus]QNP48687.1 phosphatidylserine decarboxylase [Diaphorobacter aerolatus]
MSDRIAVLPQYLLPKQALTNFMGRLASLEGGGLTTAVIQRFVAHYEVNMSEAANPDIASYRTFNEFFTRELRAGVRPLANAKAICPVDGAISQLGPIAQDQIYQAKGHTYSTTALLGGDSALAAPFTNGSFATIYLSPRDYHRIHMPCDGKLTRMIHVPGELFSVNPTTARGVPGLFARNERVVCMFDTPLGKMALVLVGATIVGSMATVWHGLVNPPRPGTVRNWTYADKPVKLRKGAEMGRFLLGSTVVLLFEPGAVEFQPDWIAARPVRLGEAMSR